MILATKKESELHEYVFTNNTYSITVKITRINEHAGVAEIILGSNISGTYTCSETVEGKFRILISDTSSNGYTKISLENGSLVLDSNASQGFYTAAVIYD